MPNGTNSQIINTIASVDVLEVGIAPAVAVAYVYQGIGQALANAANNATTAQQNSNIIDHATTSTGAATILALAPSK